MRKLRTQTVQGQAVGGGCGCAAISSPPIPYHAGGLERDNRCVQPLTYSQHSLKLNEQATDCHWHPLPFFITPLQIRSRGLALAQHLTFRLRPIRLNGRGGRHLSTLAARHKHIFFGAPGTFVRRSSCPILPRDAPKRTLGVRSIRGLAP